MAVKRMFSKNVTNTDRLQSLPLSAQALYFHLGMNADDDGFVGNPLSITRCIGASESDLGVLVDNDFLIRFQNGVYLIKDWHVKNYIRPDRYQETTYTDLIGAVYEDDGGRYQFGIPPDIPAVDPGQYRTD